MKDQMVESFNRIALLEDKWDHNQRYSKLLLKEIGSGSESVLDIGCGTGEFTQKVANLAKNVIGIDIAPQMIKEAQKRYPAKNISYILQDFDDMDGTLQFDCIVSIATFHHLSLDTALPKIRKMLKPEGTLVVLDLYERSGLADLLLDMIAVPANFLMRRIKGGFKKADPEEINAWNAHSHLDKYMSIRDLKQAYCKSLGNGVKIKRLVFWRYIAVYKKSKAE
ncbi:MAG: methyltransferase domain-containing protein [Clostridia bacterium]|nr:methyltransferase domain-containing protein [Clostridia bacterium]